MELAREQVVSLKPLVIQHMRVQIIGTSPYMPEPMDWRVPEYYDKKKSKQVAEKDIRSEEDKLKEKFYFTDDGNDGIPARAFYKAGKQGSRYIIERREGGMKKWVEGINILGDILPLEFKERVVKRHIGREASKGSSKGAPRLILRNAYIDWSVTLDIEFNASIISAEQIINILQYAGFHIGVGAFRKDCEGNFGLFKVAEQD